MAAAKPSKPFNPFYALLLVVGTLFAITACAYGVMTVQMLRIGQSGLVAVETDSPVAGGGSSLLHFLDVYGFQVMMWQLGVLAATTVAAIGLDEYFTSRTASLTRPNSVKE
jgi:uncharacterized membrane protein